MKTLEQIKDEVAKEFGYSDFHNSTFYRKTDVKICDEIAKRYAREVAQASLQKAAENAVIEPKGMMTRVDKESITNECNIVML
ncbi:hypothetical protein FCL53_10710 [Elizabethkingia meningoseptica]|uniref:hypothetical protein n=1 Tax=Elizabethkingia meningoseptica TaxID=238 RepID=UPI001365217C|nr:hypothetical protein [Elizabethkingia meningoseptica]MVW92435.1 hypothetical protein [Elizabethkingia meningoseptica]